MLVKLVGYSNVVREALWDGLRSIKPLNQSRETMESMLLKVQQRNIKFIKYSLVNMKTITMKDLLKNIQIKYHDFNISRVHLGRVVKDLNITLKQTRLRHEPKTRH